MNTIKQTVLLDSNGEEIAVIDGHLNYQGVEWFYFSMRSPHPKAISKYVNNESNFFPKEFLKDFAKKRIEHCESYHIKKFKVDEVALSLTIDYGLSVNNPKVTEILTLYVSDFME